MRISDWSSDVCSSDLIYTQEMADAGARRIQYGVQKPFRDLSRDPERSLERGRLRAEGYDEEAAALERALQLQDDIGKIGAAQYQQILDNERAQRIGRAHV